MKNKTIMEYILSVEQMRKADQFAIDTLGIPGLILMENAGLKTAQHIAQKFHPIAGKAIGIFCGKGNNGGDGFVIGRQLNRMGANAHFWLVGKKSEVSGDAKINLDIAVKLGLPIIELLSWDPNLNLQSYDILIDALLGTGLKGDIRGIYLDIIEKINSHKGDVVAVDAPTGLDCDTGKILGKCVEANLTVTMGNVKTGMLLYPGKTFVGELAIADLNVPDFAFEKLGAQAFLPQRGDYRIMLPDRPKNAYKNQFGKILVLAGSTGLTGAAMLCSKAALRSGAGMVMLGCPKSLNVIFEAALQEVMTVPLPETETGSISANAYDALHEALQWSRVLALGPGLSSHSETIVFVHRVLKEQSLPIVIDADGLNSIAEDISLFKDYEGDIIITPHVGELSHLCKISSEDILKAPVEIVREFAKKWQVVLLLKGAPTIIGDSNRNIFFNIAGNSGMATAGAGDVLTGIIAGLLGQRLTAIDAAVLGAYLHGLAGDRASWQTGQRGVIAGDIMENVSQALADLENQEVDLVSKYSQPKIERIY